MIFFCFKQNRVRNPKKILSKHELNQVVNCEGSLLEGKEKTQLYGEYDDEVRN